MKDMNECFIVGAGEFYGEFFKPQKEDFIIAADGGYNHIKKCGFSAGLLIGDFDSLADGGYNCELRRLPKEKDETDMQAALTEGLTRGYRIFRLFGGVGGRFDHTLANIQCLKWLAEQGARGYLYDKDVVMTVIKNSELEFTADYKGYISVFSLSDKSIGVCESGLKYTLKGAELTSSVPIGTSNEFIGVCSKISVSDGTLLIIYSEYQKF